MRHSATYALALAATALAALPVGQAAAEIVTLGTAGAWRALGGTADNGRALCGVAETGSDGRAFMMRYVEGARAFELLITKPRWNIQRGTRVSVAISFDGLSPWSGMADGSGNTMTLSVPQDRLRPFLTQFAAANRVYIRFPEGGEAPWQGSLAGSRAIVSQLANCISNIAQARRDGGATEPADAPSATVKKGGGDDAPAPRPAAPPRPSGGGSSGGGLKD